ncbi:MAG: ornithine cyclodeaminase [Bacilli bacterium]|nr:ornithine cyclodeaminase [Bacilli bacterium]
MNKIKILSEVDIKKILNMNIAINAVESAYKQKSDNKGEVWPLVFYEYEHNVFDLDIRSGNLDDSNAYGLKLISYNENNPKVGLNKVNATSLVCDSKTGQPIALLNAAPITSYRTGASAGIGAKYLARKDSKNLLVVGSGNIAIYSIVATLITMPCIEKVIICNPKNYNSLLNKIDNIKVDINNLLVECNLELKATIVCSNDIETSVKESDIIITATPSEKPLIKSEWVKEGTHFSCMGACMEGKQEIDELIFSKAKVYADDINQCIKSGESQTAFKNNIISNFNGEIGDVILNKENGRELEEDITIFDSTGLFIQDLATSLEILNNSNGIGIEVKL